MAPSIFDRNLNCFLVLACSFLSLFKRVLDVGCTMGIFVNWRNMYEDWLIDILFALRDWPETRGHPGQANNLVPLRTDIL
jgi:hypothetical protein